jgi:hypothetical protein
MSREIHVRFCEGLGVRFPRATRQLRICIGRATEAPERIGFVKSAGPAEAFLPSSFVRAVLSTCFDRSRFAQAPFLR